MIGLVFLKGDLGSPSGTPAPLRRSHGTKQRGFWPTFSAWSAIGPSSGTNRRAGTPWAPRWPIPGDLFCRGFRLTATSGQVGSWHPRRRPPLSAQTRRMPAGIFSDLGLLQGQERKHRRATGNPDRGRVGQAGFVNLEARPAKTAK